MNSKRGLSAVVIALIIILLSLVAVGAVWVVVKNIISGGVKEMDLGKFTIDLDITNAYEQRGNITVIVERKAGEGELVKIKFILSDKKNSEIITEEANLSELESRNFFLHPVVLVSTDIVRVSVAPVFKSAGSEIIGGIADTYYINSNGEQQDEEECTPDCTGLQCGPDPECGESCGTCTGTDVCSNGVCVQQECEPESIETTCGTWVCGTKINNCGAEVNCGEDCLEGQMCLEGNCMKITPVNSGKVEETWPGTSGMYFGSADLPMDFNYQEYYIEFPGSEEADCLLIAIYKFPIEGYSKSHIGFNFETLIETGNDYQIWATREECEA
ncbi:hypothetical protein A3K82_02740 [Candidatus Pacearchaeota archaeon RBG_19FT_COMBO_34_9]|nr:MAG: hypothetical protein A3K82_02740 [Candidatus Pacearchaeota archaeon RBG_19FT_COMBO_34_9]OGJ16974.1 MAG: hypothetical protein A3K74_01115 [Candidatus Pacearchaeota archaeon RBG_13_33_26]